MKLFGRKCYQEPVAWIAPPGARDRRGCVFRARRAVSREELDPDGSIQIVAESYYALYVNGHLAGTGPARGTRTCNFIDAHQAAAFLRAGINHIAVEVFCNNFPTFLASPAEPALFLRSGSLVTDVRWDVQLADEYRTEDVELYTLQIGLMEWRDLRGAPEGWQTFSDDSRWESAMVLPAGRPIFSKALFWRDVPHLQARSLSPVTIVATKTLDSAPDDSVAVATLLSTEPQRDRRIDLSALPDGGPADIEPLEGEKGVSFIVDFQCEFVGYLSLEIDAPAGTILDVGYQEAVQNGRLNLNPTEYRFADRFLLKEGRQTVASPLRWRGGRFLQIALRNFDRPIRLLRLEMVDLRHPIPEPAEFFCDDDFLNTLWRRCLATLSACVTDTVTDCPWREMAFWVNDFLVVNRYWLQMAGTPDVLRRCMALALSQRETGGLIGGVCPTNDDPYFTLFATNLFLPMVLKDYLIHTGDESFVSGILDEAADLVARCEMFANGDGLLCPPEGLWNFVDWSFHFNGLSLQGKNSCVVNWFLVHALDSLADLYESRDSDKAAACRTRAARIAGRINETFWSPEQDCFLEWVDETKSSSPKAGKLTHALALLSKRVSPRHVPAVTKALFRDDLFDPELYMMHFVFEAMAGLGRFEDIHQLIRKHWGSIIASDSPTIWEVNVYEHGKEAFANASSLCHAFALAPVNILQRYVLGIRPLADGFRRFSINPIPGSLRHVRGTVPTPSGLIRVEYQQADSGIMLSLTVPPACLAVLPDGREFGPGKHTLNLPAADTSKSVAAGEVLLASVES